MTCESKHWQHSAILVRQSRDRAHFATWNGTAPIDASSGEQIRHRRLSRAGNRQINRAAHDGGRATAQPD
jgi:transposase